LDRTLKKRCEKSWKTENVGTQNQVFIVTTKINTNANLLSFHHACIASMNLETK